LKLANIMIDKLRDDSLHVILVDFGFANFYVDKDGNHIDQSETVETFQGNLLFASLEQLNFCKTSRRDDMISLGYLLMYLLNNNEMPMMPSSFYDMTSQDIIKRYKKMHQFK